MSNFTFCYLIFVDTSSSKNLYCPKRKIHPRLKLFYKRQYKDSLNDVTNILCFELRAPFTKTTDQVVYQ